jgi:hypothetical protein
MNNKLAEIFKGVSSAMNNFCSCDRKYEVALNERAARRATFTRAFWERYGRQAEIMYPHALRKLPNFAEWLQEKVGKAANTTNKPSEDEFEESRLPEKVGTTYRAMYVHGMHLRVKSAEDKKVTCDSGVAAGV